MIKDLEKENQQLKEQIRVLKEELSEKVIDKNLILYKILESIQNGILVVNNENEVMFYNETFIRMWQLEDTAHETKVNEELINLGAQRLKDPAVFKKIISRVSNTSETDSGIVEFKNGRIAEYFTTPYTFSINKEGRIWYFKDITERSLFEDELQESEEKYRSFFETVKDGAFVSAADGKILDCNKGFFELFGYTDKSEMMQINIKNLYADKNERNRLVEQFTQKEFITHHELVMKKRDGSLINAILSSTVIKDSKNEIICFQGSIQNITLRKRTEEALRESELRHKTLSDLSQEGVVLHDAGILLEVNKSFCEIFGYAFHEVLGHNLLDKVIALDSVRKVKKCIESGFTGLYSAMGQKKDGTLIHLEIEARNIQYQNKKLRVANFRDVTQQKIYEKTLKESEEKYRSIFENSPSAVLILDTKLNIKAANPRACEIYEYTSDELLQLNIKKILSADLIQSEPDKIIKSVKKNKVLRIESTDIKNDGSTIDTLVKLSPYLVAGIEHIMCIITDITAQKLAQRALAERERNYSNLLTNLPGMVYRCREDKNWTMLFVSEGCFRLTGYRPEDLIGNKTISFSELILPSYSEKVWNIVTDKTSTGDYYELEYEIRTRDGQVKWVWERGRPIYNESDDLEYLEGYITDITDRKIAERELDRYKVSLEKQVEQRTAELKEANKQLAEEIVKQKEAEKRVSQALLKEKELSELKSRFISTVSHEFRTPLTSVLSSTELLEKFGRNWPEEQYFELTTRMAESVDHLTGLLDDILTISRADTGKIKLAPKEVNLKEISKKIVEEINLIITENHTINFEYKLRMNDFLLDEKLLRIILSNLLTNAVKYSPTGGQINFIISKQKEYLKFVFSDEGIGIPKEHQKHLFEPFSRADNVGEIHGTGLGMSIVKRIIDLHNGTIECKSKPGEGSCFTVLIPIITEAEVVN